MRRFALWLVGTVVAIVPPSDGRAASPGAAPAPSALTLTRKRERVLVFSPHPDDATLGAAGLIQRTIVEGGVVRVVQLTGGDGFSRGVMAIRPGEPPTAEAYRWYGTIREQESLRAMRRLGVSRAQVTLLGFPDDGLCGLSSTYRTARVFESPYTKRASPPDSEQLVRNTMYRGEDLVRELSQIVAAFRPTLIVLPHPGDQHPDHCATHLLVHQAMAVALQPDTGAPRMLHYLVHFPDWPAPDDASVLPSRVLDRGWVWTSLRLTPREQAGKQAALDLFKSQALVMPEFLNAFVRSSELFTEGEPTLPVPCWCSGENITPAARTVH
jgi:LmbE family N-acetylglucosaminyl deacetylase